MGNTKVTKSQYKLSQEEQLSCHAIIHSASASAAGVGAGLAQLPFADNALITPIQIAMIVSLGKVFEQDITKSIAKGLLSSFVASFVGRGVAQAAWGWIPIIGNASNALTAGIITESIGWMIVDHFYKEKYLSNNKAEDEVNKSENTIDEETKEDLKKRAYEFINGEKTRTGNKDEYMSLLDAFEDVLINLPESDQLYDIHNQLRRIK